MFYHLIHFFSGPSSSLLENRGPVCFGDKNKRKKIDTTSSSEMCLNEQSAHGTYGLGNKVDGESPKNKTSKEGRGNFCNEEYRHSSSSDLDCHIGAANFSETTSRDHHKLGIDPDDNDDTKDNLLSSSKSVEDIHRFLLTDGSPTNRAIKPKGRHIFKKSKRNSVRDIVLKLNTVDRE